MSSQLNAEVGVRVLWFLCILAARSAVQKVDDGEIGRHHEEYPMSQQNQQRSTRSPLKSAETHHSKAPKTVVA